ncbi:MAG: phenylalanine--tRNA ligase subunit beta, partial [Candidatus Paceibacterota bacterium]
ESVHIDTLNPVSQENITLRTGLTGGFLKAVEYNLNRNATDLRFFEVGHVFQKSGLHTWIKGVQEHTHLLFGLCGEKKPDDWRGDAINYSTFDLKADLSAFLRQILGSSDFIIQTKDDHTLNYLWGEEIIATLSLADEKLLKGFNIEKEVFIAEIDLTKVMKRTHELPVVKYTPIPKFPTFEFDAAFTVDSETRTGDMSQVIKQAAGEILKEISVFDVYEGENLGKGKKSIAFRLTFLDSNKTLNIKDVEPVVQKIVQKLEAQFNAKLRS